MKKRSLSAIIFLMVCLVFTNVLCFSEPVFAKGITSVRQVKKLAKNQVKGASIIEVERDYEDGVLVYEVRMLKSKKEYDLVYRASDAKLVSYAWEMQPWYVKRGNGKIISLNKCKKLAQKEVSGGKILSIAKKRSDGIDIYKVVMQKSSKKYELKFHARTGKLLEYEWELTRKTNNKDYIGENKAKQIALNEVGGGEVVKVEFDMDDGVPVYEVEIVEDDMEYDVKIHAVTGTILEIDVDSIYD